MESTWSYYHYVLPHKALCVFPWFNKMSFALHPSRITITNNIVSSNTVNRGRPILLITLTITDRNEVFLVLLPLCLTEVHPLSFHTKLCAFFTLHPSRITMIFLILQWPESDPMFYVGWKNRLANFCVIC